MLGGERTASREWNQTAVWRRQLRGPVARAGERTVFGPLLPYVLHNWFNTLELTELTVTRSESQIMLAMALVNPPWQGP